MQGQRVVRPMFVHRVVRPVIRPPHRAVRVQVLLVLNRNLSDVGPIIQILMIKIRLTTSRLHAGRSPASSMQPITC